MATDIIITDNSDEVISAKDAAIERAMEMIGLQMEKHAKEIVTQKNIFDTGRLRNSITHASKTFKGVASYSDNQGNTYSDGAARSEIKAGEAVVGTNVEYAKNHEFGTSKITARPFMRPALHDNMKEYEKILKSQLKD